MFKNDKCVCVGGGASKKQLQMIKEKLKFLVTTLSVEAVDASLLHSASA